MLKREEYEHIRKLDDFKHFSIVEYDKIASQIEVRKVPKGHILFFEGDKRDKLFLVKSGYFKIEQTDTSGSFVYTDFVRNDTIFPYGGMFTDSAYHFSIVAVTDVTYYYMPTELYEKYSLDNKKQMIHLYSKISRLLELHELRVRNMITSSASSRVTQSLAFLLVEMGDENDTLPFQLTANDIASMSGTTRETVSHVLSDLKHSKKLITKGKYIHFIDREFFLQFTV